MTRRYRLIIVNNLKDINQIVNNEIEILGNIIFIKPLHRKNNRYIIEITYSEDEINTETKYHLIYSKNIEKIEDKINQSFEDHSSYIIKTHRDMKYKLGYYYSEIIYQKQLDIV